MNMRGRRLRMVASLALGGVAWLGIVAGAAHAAPIEDLVTRFYNEIFDRAPETDGLAAWAAFIRSNCKPAGFDAIPRSFFGSPEFIQTHSFTIERLVRKFYRALLGREPDPAGQAAWVNVIREARMAIALRGFVPSPEFQSLLPNRSDPAAVSAVVTRLYRQLLQRAPEAEGLNAWVEYIVRTRDLEGAVRGFIASPEFEARGLTIPEYVTTLYRTFLDREPDAAGRDAWAGVLTDSMLQVINMGFVPSAEFQSLSAVLCPSSGTIPIIVGDYSGMLTLAQTTCDPNDNGPFATPVVIKPTPLVISITDQNAGQFTGGGGVFIIIQGLIQVRQIARLTISGTVSSSGSIFASFTRESVPPGSVTNGTLTGSVVGKTFAGTVLTRDVPPHTCQGAGSFSATRP